MSGPTPGDETSRPALPPDHPDRAFSPEATAAAADNRLRKDPNPTTAHSGDFDSAGPHSGDLHSADSHSRDPGPDGPDSAGLSPSASLSPVDRVIPSWTDPTVRRASDLIGGPLGRHAQVGRNKIVTPLRVCLLFAIAVLALGWVFKSPCIQQGGDTARPTLDQSGQRPWLTGCYNDVVPLYGSRGFNRPQDFPYANSFIELKDGGERRIYPSNIVKQAGGGFDAVTAKGPIRLSDKDIVGDADSGYREVQGTQLIPVGNIDDFGQVRYLEYPVLTGLFQWGVSWTTEGYLNLAKDTGVVPVPLDVAAYFTIGAFFLALFYLWAVACTARISRKRVWDTALMCLSPLLIVHAFTNWDLLPVGLCAGGMWAWSRKKPTLSGVLLGLGMAAKLYPILLLGPLLVLCLRAGKMGAWVKTLLGAAVAALAVNLPVLIQYPHAWYEFIRLNSERPPEWDSWYFIFANVTGSKIWDNDAGADSPTFLNNLSLLLFLLGCAAIGWFAMSVQRRPRFAQLAFLVVAAFLLTNKVWSPQYSIWLVPLLALALPRWRPVMIWQISEVVVWMLLMFQFAGVDNKGLSVHPFIGAAIIRDGLLIMLVVMVILDALHPARDVVRQTGDDDPSGGLLEDAPDRFTLPSLPALVRRIGGRDRPAVDEPPETESARPVLTAVPGGSRTDPAPIVGTTTPSSAGSSTIEARSVRPSPGTE